MISRTIVTVMCLIASFPALCQLKQLPTRLDSLKNIKDPIARENKIKQLSDGNEQDMHVLLNYYVNSRGSYDSILKIAVSRFPKGIVAHQLQGKEMLKAKTVDEKEQGFVKLKKDFPDQNQSRFALELAKTFAKEKNMQKMYQYFKQLDNDSRLAAIPSITPLLMQTDLKTAEHFLSREMAKPNKSNNEHLTLLKSYSQLMVKKGDYQKAFTSFSELYQSTPKKSAAFTHNYYYLMSKSGNYAGALPGLEKAVISGEASNELKEELGIAYTKLNPDRDVKVYLSALLTSLEKNAADAMTKMMVNEPAPSFAVTDMQGKRVSLADFKGKVIVLDFWATWCAPCKASLPTMQTLVNKYKKDPEVAFLFIHTWENTPNPAQDAKKYFDDNGFTLPLYMDLKDAITAKNPAITSFKAKGIPAKYIIDGSGNIRFKSAGFSGKVDAALADLSAMIELSRKDDK